MLILLPLKKQEWSPLNSLLTYEYRRRRSHEYVPLDPTLNYPCMYLFIADEGIGVWRAPMAGKGMTKELPTKAQEQSAYAGLRQWTSPSPWFNTWVVETVSFNSIKTQSELH